MSKTQTSFKPLEKYPPKFQTYLKLYIFFSFVILLKSIVSIPLILFRLLVTIYITKISTNKKQYGNILNPHSTLLADEQFTTNPTNSSIVTVLELEGKLTLTNLRLVLEKTLMLKIKGSSPSVNRYEKLRQYPENVMGYWFWKYEPNFNLDKHLNVVQFKDLFIEDDKCVDMTAVTKLHCQFLNKTFPEYTSPWVITLIENAPSSPTDKESPKKTLLVLKIHHCLADGISVLKLIVEGLGQTKAITSESSQFFQKSYSIVDLFKYYLKILIFLFPKIVQSSVDSYLFHQMTINHHWRYRSFPNKSVPSFPQFSKEIPVEMLKLKFKGSPFSSVSPSAVIITAVTESIRKFWKLKGKNLNDHIFLMTTLPKPMHPCFPTNHVNMGVIPMPDFEGNIFQALKHSDILYMSQRDDDIYHLSLQFLSDMLAILPKPFRSDVQLCMPFVTGSSNIAGNNVEFCIDNLSCKNFSLSSSGGNSAIGVVFTIFSYKKLVRFCVMAKENMLTKEESQSLADLIVENIYEMNKFVKIQDSHRSKT